ncbi:MAG: TcpE family conjugal transfer membrane protein [Caulobacteraceae bacterium]
MTEEKDYVILRTYKSVWRIDQKIYSIEGLKLLFPVSPNEVLYFTVSVAISILMIKLIPLYGNLHFVIKYVMVPYGIMKFLTKQKLDGKMPHKFFVDFIIYKLNPKKYYHFRPYEAGKKIKFLSPIIFRTDKIVNKTKLAINAGRQVGGKKAWTFQSNISKDNLFSTM